MRDSVCGDRVTAVQAFKDVGYQSWSYRRPGAEYRVGEKGDDGG
jgi:hypothetical protein